MTIRESASSLPHPRVRTFVGVRPPGMRSPAAAAPTKPYLAPQMPVDLADHPRAPSLTRTELIAKASAGSANAGALDAMEIQMICRELVDALVGKEAAERQLAATRAGNRALQRQLALKINSLPLTVLRLDLDAPAEGKQSR